MLDLINHADCRTTAVSHLKIYFSSFCVITFASYLFPHFLESGFHSTFFCYFMHSLWLPRCGQTAALSAAFQVNITLKVQDRRYTDIQRDVFSKKSGQFTLQKQKTPKWPSYGHKRQIWPRLVIKSRKTKTHLKEDTHTRTVLLTVRLKLLNEQFNNCVT